jgi:isopentenyl-diphosphate delta-isomerase
MNQLTKRKLSHLDLCATEDVESQNSTLLEQVGLLHEALPDLSLAEVDPSVHLFGRRLRAPLLIAGMSGGPVEARRMNRALATAAQRYGIGMGVGSQRPMLLEASASSTYEIRDVAPDILLLANIGAVQARDAGAGRVAELVSAIGADAVCIHLNAAQELVQDEGDRDFRGCVPALAALVAELPVPVIVKETGCGLSPRTLERLSEAGVRWVDVAGRGGTTWTGVEALRGSTRQRALGEELREWGIPTAASVVYARACGLRIIASGGIRGAKDAVRALALGADAVAAALPFLRAYRESGVEGVFEVTEQLIEALTAMMLLTGCRRVDELHHVPRVLGPDLRAWCEPVGAWQCDGNSDTQ